jgi:hypothetical protein
MGCETGLGLKNLPPRLSLFAPCIESDLVITTKDGGVKSRKKIRDKQAEFSLLACTAYSSALKMEAVRSFDTSVNLYWSIRRHIPQDSTLNEVLFEIYVKICRN